MNVLHAFGTMQRLHVTLSQMGVNTTTTGKRHMGDCRVVLATSGDNPGTYVLLSLHGYDIDHLRGQHYDIILQDDSVCPDTLGRQGYDLWQLHKLDMLR